MRPGISSSVPGSYGIMSTDIRVLRAIFSRVPILDDDVLVDIGCGDGDVIDYWLSKNIQNKLIGIELDRETSNLTKERFKNYENVEIIYGDASLGHPDGTLFYLFNPFRGDQMRRFERTLSWRPVRVIYNAWHDLDIFEGWNIKQLQPEPDEFQFRVAILTPPF